MEKRIGVAKGKFNPSETSKSDEQIARLFDGKHEQLAHALRQALARMAALKYGREDDLRRDQWKQELTRFREEMNRLLSECPELQPAMDTLNQSEWPNAREIAARLITG